MTRRLRILAAAMVIAGSVVATGAAQEAGTLPPSAEKMVDFAKEIRPILAKSCYSCHGPEKQEGGLRLHRKQEALQGGDSGAVVVAGNSAESKLIRYVTGLNKDGMLMPPDGEGDRLSKDQVALLRAWIDQGLKWPDEDGGALAKSQHWSFQPLKRPSLPPVKNTAAIRNGIDAFVLAKQEGLGIVPSTEAERTTLLRRLSLDLRGLPPSLAEVDEFMNDHRPDAYEQLVERMLASPHYGERWGRHWLDLARYADSDGYEKDTARPFAWRYRNWVIEALNRDLPFDRFTVEQLAGDLLSDANLESRVATGFHRNTLTNKEGGVDQEEFRVKATVDRVNTTGTVWLGLTVGCAQCHTHKYDPISQREYYGLFAFFNSLNEENIPAPLPGELEKYTQAKQIFDREHAPYLQAIAEFEREQLPARQAEWVKSALTSAAEWVVLEPVSMVAESGIKLAKQMDNSLLAGGKNPDKDKYTIALKTDLAGITAIRLETLSDPKLPSQGPGRTAHGNFVLTELQASVAPASDPSQSTPLMLDNASADFVQGGNQFPPAYALDGKPNTGWAVAGQEGRNHLAVFEVKQAVEHEGGTLLTVVLDQQYGGGHTIGRPRVSVTSSTKPIQATLLPDDVVAALRTEASQRSTAQQAAITRHYRTVDPDLAKLEAAAAEHAKRAPADPGASIKAQVLVEAPNPRPTQVMIRGDFLRPGDRVEPHLPAVFPPLKLTERRPPTRLDLANWLVDRENPLTARVTVNRIWQTYFGRGLVVTSEDFGTQGQRPSHPELLDWLACEFMDRGWSLKSLHRLIVTSATYRQSSAARPELVDRDPQNVLLARQNRIRVEAEVIRDLALSVSDLLNPAIGGPSVRPPQPAGVSELTYANSAKWVESKGPDRYRRGMYTHFQRTSPYPMLMTFDSPDSNVCAVRRERSNTPLQALTLLNDSVFVESAQALGKRILAERPNVQGSLSVVTERLRHGFRLCLAREPTAEELERLEQLFSSFHAACKSQPEEAARLLGPTNSKDLDTSEAAAYVAYARVLLNLDEFVTRE